MSSATPAVNKQGCARELAFGNGAKVVDLDLDGGTAFRWLERGEQSGSHSGVRQREQHTTVDDAAGVEVMRLNGQRQDARACPGFDDPRADVFDEWKWHGAGAICAA